MRRDFIIVVGEQGFGKSVWTKLYTRSHTRLFVYDPKAEYPDVDYQSPPDDWLVDVMDGRIKQFRYGSCFPSEIPMFGNAAYATGNCTLAIEECALIFPRNARLDEWATPLIFMGRERVVNLVLTAQRATKIPIDIRSQASRIVTFRQTEPDDVAALAERIGRETESQIISLPELTCLDWEGGRTRTYSIKPA